MPLGMEVDFVFDGDPAFPQKKGTAPPPNFWPMCIVTKRLDGSRCHTLYGGKARRRRPCVRWGRSSPLRRAQPPVFGSCLVWPNDWMDEDATWYWSRPRPRPYCVRRGPSCPAKGAQQPPLFGHVYCGHGRPSQLLL